jgi:hypothetical protein
MIMYLLWFIGGAITWEFYGRDLCISLKEKVCSILKKLR